MSKNFWINRAEDFLHFEHPSEKEVLHPLIVEKINNFAPEAYLDYGAGDGRMSAKINGNIPIDIFDISPTMMKNARKVLGDRLKNEYTYIKDIPKNHYDVVVCSMVLVCIKEKEEYMNTLNAIQKALKVSGKAIFSVTHPCFRQMEYSDFYTEYLQKKQYDYFSEGNPFGVTIHNTGKKRKVSFDDYHWSLSFMMNNIIQSGLIIKEIIETTDDKKSKNYNKFFPPYLIIITEKQ